MRPAVLYKYVAPRWTSVLSERLLRFTPPNLLNDPYESLPLVSGPNPESVRQRLSDREDLNDVMSRVVPFFQMAGPEVVLDEVSRSFGVLCLASAPDHLLLWAHYGAGHRGFVVGFDSNHPWFHAWNPPTPPINGVQPVVYQTGRPMVQVGHAQDLGKEGLARLARGMLYTKASAWSYEGEWRLTRPLERATKVSVDGDGGSKPFFAYPPECVVEVIIGARCSDAQAGGLRSAVRAGQLARARVRRAYLSASTYGIEIADVEGA